MTDEPAALDDKEDERDFSGEVVPSSKQLLIPADVFRGLDAFSVIQRQIVAADFSGLTAAQRTIEQLTAFKVPAIVAAQEAVAKNFAKSIDFSRLALTHRALLDAGILNAASAVQTQWANSLAESLDFSALRDTVASSSELIAFSATNLAVTESIQRQADVLARIGENVLSTLGKVDVALWISALDRWIPVNLREVEDLESVAAVALDAGIPLAWIPRPEIVLALLRARSSEERHEILTERTNDILDDCEAVLVNIENEWGCQCKNAIGALRAGFDAPAQSHASNIIDSVVLALHGKNGRDEAKKRAEPEVDDLPLQLAAENLTLRPLLRAFTAWWPSSGDIPPDHFARHSTSHAVGHVGVFASLSALVAVMLATSVTVQYSPGVQTPDGDSDSQP